jgi:hypothetical protein
MAVILCRWEVRRHQPSTILARVADPDHAVAEAWGVWGEKSKEGRTYEGIIRLSFLVDADGRIREAWYQGRPNGRFLSPWRRSRRRGGRRDPRIPRPWSIVSLVPPLGNLDTGFRPTFLRQRPDGDGPSCD